MSGDAHDKNPAPEQLVQRAGEQAGERVGERVGEITGERPCVACGYSLRRQPIVREPNYGLLIARCPECGTVAALQEYPALAAGALRLRTLAALGLLLVVVGLLAAHAGLTAGMVTVVQAGGSSERAVETIAEAWAEHYNEYWARGEDLYRGQYQHVLASDGSLVTNRWAPIRSTWFTQQDDLRASIEPGLFDWPELLAQTPPGGLAVMGALLAVAGGVWSVLLRSPRWSIALVSVLPIGVATVLIFESADPAMRPAMGAWVDPTSLVRELQFTGVVTAGAVAAFACTALGVWQGRRVARWTVRAVLPPDMRGAFVSLWIRDGLEPAKGAVGPARDHPEAHRNRPA
ncbi:MAG: hypothetical protein AAGF47_04425 [Planctomycetota bacterium]